MYRFRKPLIRLAEQSQEASRALANLQTKTKDKILVVVALRLKREVKAIVRANQKDLKTARSMGATDAMIDRLTLDTKRVKQMADAVDCVRRLKDPIGRTAQSWKRPNGLKISKVIVPLGVILIIYESRPNVTSECASLCLKSGNAVLLRGGREAFHSNRAIVGAYHHALKRFSVPVHAVTLIPILDRCAVDVLLKLETLINLVIPRGGEALIRRVARNARMPVVKHYKGICHVYVDKDADIRMASDIAFNAKCQRTGVCNAMETLLVHKDIAPKLLPGLGVRYLSARCEIRGDALAQKLIPGAKKATEKDWGTEYLDRILSVRVVRNLDQAVEHIRRYGSAHTDSIVTRNQAAARKFTELVDSSSVMVNASTRFSDGNEYGFGAEIGISTDKVHARGPMGLEGLTSYKYVVHGKGQIRQ